MTEEAKNAATTAEARIKQANDEVTRVTNLLRTSEEAKTQMTANITSL